MRLARIHASLRELSLAAAEDPQSRGRWRPLLFVPPAAAAAAFLALTFFLTRPAARLEEKVGRVEFDGTLTTVWGSPDTARALWL
jgi:hypothetical protein